MMNGGFGPMLRSPSRSSMRGSSSSGYRGSYRGNNRGGRGRGSFSRGNGPVENLKKPSSEEKKDEK